MVRKTNQTKNEWEQKSSTKNPSSHTIVFETVKEINIPRYSKSDGVWYNITVSQKILRRIFKVKCKDNR